MPHADFVHLRVHSAYSLAQGAIKVKDLVKLCTDNQMPAVAMTDTNNMFGALEFAMSMSGAGVQPILGCQLGVTPPDMADNPTVKSKGLIVPDQLVLLAQNMAGYNNLLKLVSAAYMKTDGQGDAQISLDEFEGHTDGLICLTGGPKGGVGRLLSMGQHVAATDYIARLEALFAGRLYVEILRHDSADENVIEEDLIKLAYERDLPLVGTNNCFFATRDMYEAHDALLCIASGSYVIQEDRPKVTPEHYFKSAAEMREIFADIPEAADNTLVIAKRCSFLLKPIDPILPPFDTGKGRTEVEELRHQAHEGLDFRLEAHVYTDDMDEARRAEVTKEYRERLDYELGIIENMGFPGYFLIVADFIKWAKEQGIPVGPGRGSGAGSLVAWSMKITDLDPLELNLLFERFLNPERVSMPDFDVDFCQDRRDEVIRYVQNKYGHDHVAQIITFGKLQARAVLRDVGRVLQMPYGMVDKIAKMVPNNPANPTSLGEALETEPDLQRARRTDEMVARLINTALKLEGLYRHASTHAAGVVIGDRPLDELIPLYRDPRSDMPVTQFNMKFVEQAGLVKFDFLGLKTLTVLQRAVDLIKQGGGPELDLLQLPMGDEETYQMLSRGETTGVFQLESAGMRDVLRKLKPNRFEEIIALVALYRPGPMDNIPTFINVKEGKEKPDYMHPKLKPILEETFGIMIYQEQVMQTAQVLAGYSLGGADLLRRAMGKKIQEAMDAEREKFVAGAKEQGVPEEQSGHIFDQVAKFAGYGFNKSHAAAYALVAYQTAYLKANYPVEFLAASMTYDMGNTDKLNIFKQELDRLKIPLLSPDVNKSYADFAVEFKEPGNHDTKAIRYALGALKGVGETAMERMTAERDANGPFKDPFDLMQRMDAGVMSRKQLEILAGSGAFECMDKNRARIHDAADTLIRYGAAAAQERESGQVSLFGGGGGVELQTPDMPDRPDWEELERLRKEFDAIGFYLSAHPLDSKAQQLKRLKVVSIAGLKNHLRKSHSTRVSLAGIVVRKQERISAKGNRFAFVQLSDASGVYEITLFSEMLAIAREHLEPGTPVMIQADAQENGEEIRLTAQVIEALDDALSRAMEGVTIYIDSAEPAGAVKTLLERQGKGRIKVSLVVQLAADQEVELEIPSSYKINGEAKQALKAIDGILDIQEI